MNIILSNTTVNNGNRGCMALAVTTMYLLSDILQRKGIPYTFYLPQSSYSSFGVHHFDSEGIHLEYNSLMEISPKSLKRRLKHIVKIVDYQKSRNIYKSADYIFDIGQGDSFSDIYGSERFNWIYGQYQLGMKYKKAYCILPQTIGPFKDAKIRSLALKAIAKASCVMVRDKQSLDFVKRELPDKPVSEIIDVAFFMPYKKKSFDDKYVHVGLNISGLLWHGGYTQDNQFGLVSDYQSVIRDIIDYFLSLENVKLHLISHVVAENRIIENDYAVAYDLCEEYSHPNLILSPMFLDAIAAKGYISGMDFFMGARMHATIAAFSSNVPVYPMAYSRKFNGLFVDTLQYDYIGDMKVQSASDMLSDIKNAFVNRSVLKSLISNRMSTIVEERRNLLVKELEKFLGL